MNASNKNALVKLEPIRTLSIASDFNFNFVIIIVISVNLQNNGLVTAYCYYTVCIYLCIYIDMGGLERLNFTFCVCFTDSSCCVFLFLSSLFFASRYIWYVYIHSTKVPCTYIFEVRILYEIGYNGHSHAQIAGESINFCNTIKLFRIVFLCFQHKSNQIRSQTN